MAVGFSAALGSGFSVSDIFGSGNGREQLKPGQKPGYESAPQDCDTCKHRKYQDGSDEENVSFKQPAHVSPQASGAAVRAHEAMHVSNAYRKAAQSGGQVLACGVSVHQAVCPECGSVYTAGGLTTTVTRTPKGDGDKKADAVSQASVSNPYARYKASVNSMMNRGHNFSAGV